MSYIQSLYHVVICTKHRSMTIPTLSKTQLYKYIWGIVNKRNCKLIKMNGIPNHIHLLIELKSTIAIADLVRDIKRASSLYAKQSGLFPMFEGWSAEYAAFTVSYSMKEKVINYIDNQEIHHNKETFESEYKRLAILHGVNYYENENIINN